MTTDTAPSPVAPAVVQRRSRLHPGLGAALVFVASAAVLVLEIVAMRLVAPYIGITLQTSSAVIGVALSAMALGAWLGGRFADRRDAERLLAPVLVAAGVLGIATVPAVRIAGEQVSDSASPVSVLLLAVLAVFAPCALLSTVTPVVVKTQLADLGRTGSTVGRLSGIATLGAITATFLTGFVLLGAFRSSVIVIGTGALLVVAGLALLVRRPDRRTLVAAAVALPLAPWLFAGAPNPCQFETDYHCARVVETPPGSTVRELRLDTLAHSSVDLADPAALAYPVTKAMTAAVESALPGNRPLHALYIGGGAMTLPRYQAATRPGSSADVLEIDGKVTALSRTYLGAADIPRLTVTTGDARTAVRRSAPGSYDLVVGDAFGALAAPWHLTTVEAARDIRTALKPDGVYVANLIDYTPDRFVRAEIATLRTLFAHVVVTSDAGVFTGGEEAGGNHVVVASQQPVPVADLARRLRTAVPGWRLLDADETAAFAADARVLTDDFAPVDQLFTQVPRADEDA